MARPPKIRHSQLPQSLLAATALRNAPLEDEPETEEDRLAAFQARDWLKNNGGKGIPHSEAIRRLGMDSELEFNDPV